MASPDLSTLTWTTRAEVAAHLAHYLRATSPPPDLEATPEFSPRVRAGVLLGVLAGPALRDCLRALALDPSEEIEVRQHALRALARLGVGLSGPNLMQLLTDDALCEDEYLQFGTEDLLTLAQRSDAQAAARQFLLTLSAEDRTEILARSPDGTPAPLMEWMYGKWLHEDRYLLATDRGPQSANRSVIRVTLDRVESRAVLQEMWREAEGAERRELLHALHDEETEWEFPGAAETAELAEELALPTEALVTYWGRERLLERFDAVLLAEHIRWETRRHPLGTFSEYDSTPYLCMLRVLGDWLDPELDQWIVSRATDARLHEDARWGLLHVLWCRNRALCASAVIDVLAAGERYLAGIMVDRPARDPVESDRALLREASRPIHESQLQYRGLCGLERLGETGDEWRSRLDAWTRHPEPRLRIRALGALAQRGEPDALDALLGYTEAPHPLQERAEAIALLAEIDAPAHLPLFVHALAREELPDEDDRCTPAAEEAAFALACLGTPDALTALIQSCLTARAHYLQVALERYLTAIVDPGPDTLQMQHAWDMGWRGFIRPRWKESA